MWFFLACSHVHQTYGAPLKMVTETPELESNGVMGSCGTPSVFWALNQCHLQEQPVLLTTRTIFPAIQLDIGGLYLHPLEEPRTQWEMKQPQADGCPKWEASKQNTFSSSAPQVLPLSHLSVCRPASTMPPPLLLTIFSFF